MNTDTIECDDFATAGQTICVDGTTGETIQEDDPRWDCATMGNRICGPTQAPTPEVITTAPTTPPVSIELARTGTEANLAGLGLALILVGHAIRKAATR